jgi:histidinol-phosphatase
MARESDIRSRLELALELALDGGDVTLRYFQQDNYQLLRAGIAERFPLDGILGEEFGEQPGSSGFRWIVDPIDGTKSFIFGVPLYGTMVGVEYDGEAVVGVVNVPALGECVYAGKGQGCLYQRRGGEPVPARVSSNERLDQGLFVVSQVDSFEARGAGEAFRELQQKSFVTRTWGDCYGYLLVATGRADVMIDPIMNVWDAAAIQPIMQEAGGTFTDWQGRATIHAGEGIGTNGRVLKEVLAVTRRYSKPA